MSYNPACDTCTYAWCCGRCYCCHPPVFRIVVDDPAPVVVDETPRQLDGGLWVPAWVDDLIHEQLTAAAEAENGKSSGDRRSSSPLRPENLQPKEGDGGVE